MQRGLRERAPKVQRPARVGSKFLLSGLLRCGTCGRPFIGQGAKSGQYGYYVCGTLHRQGAGTCQASYLNAPKVGRFVIDKIKERILTDETLTELVTIVAEEIDAMAGEIDGRLKAIEAELADMESRLENLYEALETKHLTLEALSPRILALRHRQDHLTGAKEEAESQLEQRRVDLPDTKEIKGYVEAFRTCLQEGTLLECKALIRNFVKSIEVVGGEATLTYCEWRRDNVPPGRSSAEVWRLKTVPPVAFNQERQNLTEGGLDVQGGYLPPCSQGLFRRRDERPRGGPSVRATPGHGAQDARVLRAPRVSTATTGSQTEARSI